MLQIDKHSKYVFWMPTFRNTDRPGLNEHTIACETGLPLAYTDQSLEELNELLKNKDMMLIIKLHQYQKESVITKKTYSNIIVINNERLDELGLQVYTVLSNRMSSSPVRFCIHNVAE